MTKYKIKPKKIDRTKELQELLDKGEIGDFNIIGVDQSHEGETLLYLKQKNKK